MTNETIFAAFIATIGIASAVNARFLAPSVVFAVGLLTIYPDTDNAVLLMFFYLVSLFLTILRR